MNIVSKCVHVGSSIRELTWKPAWLDKALRPSISNVIWVLSSDTDTICQVNQLFSNLVRQQCCLVNSFERTARHRNW